MSENGGDIPRLEAGAATAAAIMGMGLATIPTSEGCAAAFMRDAHPAQVSAAALIGILAAAEKRTENDQASIELAKMLQEATALAAGLVVRVATLEAQLIDVANHLSSHYETGHLWGQVTDAIEGAGGGVPEPEAGE